MLGLVFLSTCHRYPIKDLVMANLEEHQHHHSLPRVLSGPWQVMLKQADGSYACVAESATRFTLGEVITHTLFSHSI